MCGEDYLRDRNSYMRGFNDGVASTMRSQHSITADERMVDLIRLKTGIEMHPVVLRLFIKQNWPEVKRLAHLIHEDR